MTTRVPLSLPTLYEQDYVLWLEKTAEQLKRGNFAEVDLENLIEEIESMGRSERQAIESLLTVLVEHLLKLTYWEREKERNANHWRLEIANFRLQLKRKLKSTTLTNHARAFFAESYADARGALISARIIEAELIPSEPLFSLEQALDLNWWPIEDNDRW